MIGFFNKSSIKNVRVCVCACVCVCVCVCILVNTSHHQFSLCPLTGGKPHSIPSLLSQNQHDWLSSIFQSLFE